MQTSTGRRAQATRRRPPTASSSLAVAPQADALPPAAVVYPLRCLWPKNVLAAANADAMRIALESSGDIRFRQRDGWTNFMLSAMRVRSQHKKPAAVPQQPQQQQRGADINARDNLGRSALMLAAMNGHVEAVCFALDNKADITAKDNSGMSSLLHSAANGHVDVVRILLDRRADVNSKDLKGRTALTHAAAHGHTECMRVLLESRADVNMADGEGITPLMYAAANGFENAMTLALEWRADIHAKEHGGRTALVYAAANGHVGAMRRAIDWAADVSVRDVDGMTIATHAAANGHKDAVSFAMNVGCCPNGLALFSHTASARYTNAICGEVISQTVALRLLQLEQLRTMQQVMQLENLRAQLGVRQGMSLTQQWKQ